MAKADSAKISSTQVSQIKMQERKSFPNPATVGAVKRNENPNFEDSLDFVYGSCTAFEAVY